MKFIAFFTFVATVNALTEVFPSRYHHCLGEPYSPLSVCGCSNLVNGALSSRDEYDGYDQELNVTWYEGESCQGASFPVGDSVSDEEGCYELPFTGKSVFIHCLN